MIDKVVEIRWTQPDGRRTGICYHVHYAKTKNNRHGRTRIFGSNENLPLTVLNFILADDVKCDTEYQTTLGDSKLKKVVTYTR